MLAATLFGLMAAFLVLGVPVVFAVGAAATLAVVLLVDTMPLLVVPMSMFNGMDSFPMMAVPFFILAGELMNRGGISLRLVNFSKTLVGHITGGLGHSNVVANAIMAAISGSALANIAAVGRVLIPAMKKEKYPVEIAASLTICSSLLGPIIPPSITMVIFAVTAGQSVGALFLGGVVPGLLIALGMMAVIYFWSRRRGYGEVQPFSGKAVWREARNSGFALLMPVIILGGIFTGVMTPTEAAAVAVLYALLIGIFVYRELTFRELWRILLSTGMTTSFIMLIIGAARIFSDVMLSEAVPQSIASAMLGVSDNPYILLLLINVLLLLVGCVMDTTAAIIILVPVLMPVIQSIGVDPVLFGVIMSLNLVIGMATPPIGVALYLGAEVSGCRVERIIPSMSVLLGVHIFVLLLISYVPTVALWLPHALGY
ncbi:TRAP transporter large permease [Castellaniella sp.]|uniref:TRAP transporter large permease n=1 Tax=Castellaniella sp. TaxID=1955812 RepID=UPI00355D260B